MGLWTEILKTAISYLIAIALGAVVTALQARKRMIEFEREVVKPLRDDVATLKLNYVTRAELERDLKQLREDMKEWIGVPPAGDVTRSAPLGRRSFLLCPPLRVFSMGLAAKRLSVLEAL